MRAAIACDKKADVTGDVAEHDPVIERQDYSKMDDEDEQYRMLSLSGRCRMMAISGGRGATCRQRA